MTKKETTTPVVKAEKTKVKRVRKPKTTEKPIAVETPLQPDVVEEKPQVSIQEQIENAVNEAKAKVKKETEAIITEYKSKAHDAQVELSTLKNTYNQLKDDYKVLKNKYNQASSDAAEKKTELHNLKNQWKTTKKAYDDTMGQLQSTRNALNESKVLCTELETEYKRVKMLGVIYACIGGAALIALAIVAALYC